MNRLRLARRPRMLGAAFACALMAALWCVPGAAWAYFSYPAPSVSVPGSVELYSGDTQQVTCAIDPLSERQLPGCGMAECPQGCDGLENPQTGVVGGCLSADGWCTCAGTMYSTVQTNVSVSSSNPSVARATWAGGVLSISGFKPGSVTVTINATLAKHESASAQVHVQVVAKPSSGGQAQPAASAPTDTTTSTTTGKTTSDSTADKPSSSGGNAQTSAASASSSSETATASGGGASTSTKPSASASSSGTSATSGGTVSAAAAGQTGGPSVNVVAGGGASAQSTGEAVTEIVSREGDRIVTAQAGSVNAAEELKKIAATSGRVTFWSGGTADSPDVSVTFYGEDLAADANLDIDATVKASKKGSGDVAALLGSTQRSIVVEFAQAGALPAEAEMYVRASAVFDDGTSVGLYRYDAKTGAFVLVKDDLKVSDGYVSFRIDEAATYALSDEDLAALAPADATREGGPAAQEPADAGETAQEPASAAQDATKVDVHAKSGTPYLAVGGVVAMAAVVGAVTYLVMRRRARAALDAVDAAGTGDANGAGPDGDGPAGGANGAGSDDMAPAPNTGAAAPGEGGR